MDAVPLHPKTADFVDRFAAALKVKLSQAEQKYGYSDGWSRRDWLDECRKCLREHVEKGDPRDVAAYCAFLWHHGTKTVNTRHSDAAPWITDVGHYTTPPAMQPQPRTEVQIDIPAEMVAWLRKRRDDFVAEFGSVDPETGTLEFGSGPRGRIREEHVANLNEEIEHFDLLASGHLEAIHERNRPCGCVGECEVKTMCICRDSEASLGITSGRDGEAG
jgi:hypothetical protein